MLLSEHSEWRYERLGDRFAGEVAAYWDRVMLRALNLAAAQVPYRVSTAWAVLPGE